MFLAEGIDLALRQLRAEGVRCLRVMSVSYWDFIDQNTIARLYPNGFDGWAVEHGGVLETSLMLHWYPNLVDMEAVIDHPPATFPPYDLYPPNPDWVPASGTLSSAKCADRQKGKLIAEVSGNGIYDAVRDEFSS